MLGKFSRAGLASAGFYALLPAAATGGGLALAPALGLAGLLAVRLDLLKQAMRPSPALVLAFGLWALFSTIWTTAPDHGQAVRLAATTIPGLLLAAGIGADERAKRLTRAAGLASILVLMGLLAAEALYDMPFNRGAQPDAETWALLRNPGRGATVLVVMLWAVLGAVLTDSPPWRRIGVIALLAAGAGWLSLQFGMDANALGFCCGAVAFSLALAAPRTALFGVAGIIALWLLAAPFAIPLLFADPSIGDALPMSWAMRLDIWTHVSGLVLEKPVFGHGLDASRAFPDTIMFRGEEIRALQLHPHNASLQIWLETGGIGAALGAAALIAGAMKLARTARDNRALAAAASGTLATFGFIANVSYGLWQEWWVATAFAAACVLAALGGVHMRQSETPAGTDSRGK